MEIKSWKLANWAEVIETLMAPYLEVEGFADVYARIKAVDSDHFDPSVLVFMERYLRAVSVRCRGALTGHSDRSQSIRRRFAPSKPTPSQSE